MFPKILKTNPCIKFALKITLTLVWNESEGGLILTVVVKREFYKTKLFLWAVEFYGLIICIQRIMK